MLSAYFDLPTADKPAKPFGKSKKGPKPTESATTTVHVKFEPLPPEKNVPKPAEGPGQPWSAFDESAAVRDDDVAAWDYEEDAMEDDLQSNEDGEISEPDFEPDSLESAAEESLGSSIDDADMMALFGRGKRKAFARSAVAVYSGPQLWYEDEDFD